MDRNHGYHSRNHIKPGASVHGERANLTVSKPMFASKYHCESSRREVHITLFCTSLESLFYKKLAEMLLNVTILLLECAECLLDVD